jgi:hypothetical protein
MIGRPVSDSRAKADRMASNNPNGLTRAFSERGRDEQADSSECAGDSWGMGTIRDRRHADHACADPAQ